MSNSIHNHIDNLIVPSAFVRGIRHIGYRTNSEAIAEFIDNSIQANAAQIEIAFDCKTEGRHQRIEAIAVIDDGQGMDLDAMHIAMLWGGTQRENDRDGLGRFGYGLPSAAVSMARRFTILSKQREGQLNSVSLDLDVVDSGSYSNSKGELSISPPKPATLSPFLTRVLRERFPVRWRSGTIILLEKLDRLDWLTADGLRRNLMRHLGVTYHKLLQNRMLSVDNRVVRPIDPLFLEPNAELYALDEDRAIGLDTIIFNLSLDEPGGYSGVVTMRYSWLPPTFASIDKSRDAIGLNANSRFPIMKEYNGIFFCRNGRVIDVKTRTPWTTFINNDRYIRVEIDFAGSLDEGFGVTTSKQQVSVAPTVWDRLRVAGLQKAIEHLRSKVRVAKSARIGALRSSKSRLSVGPQKVCRPDDLQEIIRHAPFPALQMLLSEIDGRSSKANGKLQEEYCALLRGWKSRLKQARLSSTGQHTEKLARASQKWHRNSED